MKLVFLAGVLSNGTPYTLTIEGGELVLEHGEHRQTARGPAGILDYLQAEGVKMPSDAEQRLCQLAWHGSDVVKFLIDKKGHADRVTADDINAALKQGIADADIQAAIRTLLFGRKLHKEGGHA